MINKQILKLASLIIVLISLTACAEQDGNSAANTASEAGGVISGPPIFLESMDGGHQALRYNLSPSYFIVPNENEVIEDMNNQMDYANETDDRTFKLTGLKLDDDALEFTYEVTVKLKKVSDSVYEDENGVRYSITISE